MSDGIGSFLGKFFGKCENPPKKNHQNPQIIESPKDFQKELAEVEILRKSKFRSSVGFTEPRIATSRMEW